MQLCLGCSKLEQPPERHRTRLLRVEQRVESPFPISLSLSRKAIQYAVNQQCGCSD